MGTMKMPFTLEKPSDNDPVVNSEGIYDKNFKQYQHTINEQFKNDIAELQNRPNTIICSQEEYDDLVETGEINESNIYLII